MGDNHPPAQAHEPIEQLFEDVYWVHGTASMGPGMRINRNMVVLRHCLSDRRAPTPDADASDGELTLINPVRLSEAGEKDLLALGAVKHIVRIGYFHSMDDAYYVERHGARFWCQAGSNRVTGPKPDELIEEGTRLPFPGAKVFAFRDTKFPEAAVLVQKHGGLLVTCDSVQHHVDTSGCSLPAKAALHLMGFMHPVNIGPPWRKFMTKQGDSLKSDFERLLKLEFEHAIGAHGRLCKGGARDALATTVARVFA